MVRAAWNYGDSRQGLLRPLALASQARGAESLSVAARTRQIGTIFLQHGCLFGATCGAPAAGLEAGPGWRDYPGARTSLPWAARAPCSRVTIAAQCRLCLSCRHSLCACALSSSMLI